MAALAVALVIWRADVVRLLPQTAAFFQFTGLGVNLRNLAIEDVRVSTEMVNGSRVFVIEGAVSATSRKAVEIPRLRFVVQDAHGADIYAWNAVVDQAVIQPGETEKIIGGTLILLGTFRSVSSMYFLYRMFKKPSK